MMATCEALPLQAHSRAASGGILWRSTRRCDRVRVPLNRNQCAHLHTQDPVSNQGLGLGALSLSRALGPVRGEYRDAGSAPETRSLHCSKSAPSPLRIFVSTGDVMGDIHGANLVKEILKQAAESEIHIEVDALGGQRMKEAGATLIGDSTGLSSIGLLEALPFILPSLRVQRMVRKFLDDNPPDIVVLLDYPGVNIPFGRYMKEKHGCPIIYYIPPNEWLWNDFRSNSIVTMSNTILSVYPGEADYYAGVGGNVVLVGHPLVDSVRKITRDEARIALSIPAEDLVVALLPASRAQELKHVWPTMASAAGKLCRTFRSKPDTMGKLHFVIPEVLSDQRHLIERYCEVEGFRQSSLIWHGDSHIAMAASDVAISKSGSVNLELALYNVPQVVVYKIDKATAWIARRLFGFSLKHVSLVNLILSSEVVPEFIQEEADADSIFQAALALLPDTENCLCLSRQNGSARRTTLDGYDRLRALLGNPGAVSRAAQTILANS